MRTRKRTTNTTQSSSLTTPSCRFSCYIQQTPSEHAPYDSDSLSRRLGDVTRIKWFVRFVSLPVILCLVVDPSSDACRVLASTVRAHRSAAPPQCQSTRPAFMRRRCSIKNCSRMLENVLVRGGDATVVSPSSQGLGGTATFAPPATSWLYSLKVAISGGLAGAAGTAVLYPLDAAKTLRQSRPSEFPTVRAALWHLLTSTPPSGSSHAAKALERGGSRAAETLSAPFSCAKQSTVPTMTTGAATASRVIPAASAAPRLSIPSVIASEVLLSQPLLTRPSSRTTMRMIRAGCKRTYAGWWPAVLGSIPSSALYFGAYEGMKQVLLRRVTDRTPSRTVPELTRGTRLVVHAAAAASGNCLSSLVFVPKECIKQRMQASGCHSVSTVVQQILAESCGVRGLFRGYQATLMRNIPSAILRFVIYEELKHSWVTAETSGNKEATQFRRHGLLHLPTTRNAMKLMLAGALAGSVASGLLTPVDVLKTRLSTGTCPVDVRSCVLYVFQSEGWSGLFAGSGSRMVWSGAFSAIGFGTFETVKTILGVDQPPSVVLGSKRTNRNVEMPRPRLRIARTSSKPASPWKTLSRSIQLYSVPWSPEFFRSKQPVMTPLSHCQTILRRALLNDHYESEAPK
jgi:Mitochondrial carrier protein